MHDSIDSEEYRGYTINIYSDDDPMNPRTECDNLGTMLCYHGRYTLGDADPVYKSDDQNGWDELEEKLIKEQHAVVVLPLYLYDHSGITMNTGGFSCSWDSGQVGFIYVTREKVLKEYLKARHVEAAVLERSRPATKKFRLLDEKEVRSALKDL